MRHDHKLALTGRLSWWPALHVVKDENYNLNDHDRRPAAASTGR